MGFVDLHLHLLPEIDDGCRSMDETVVMAKLLVSLGFTTAAPSPHNRAQYQPQDVCLTRLEQVRAVFQQQSIALSLEPNAENFFLDEHLLAAISAKTSRRIGADGKYLLVEAPYTSPLPQLSDQIFRMKLKGVTPVIAHPERCMEFERPGRAAEAVQLGAVLQLDVGALTGRYGKPAERLAREFLGKGLYGIAATDLHSPVGAEEWVTKSLSLLEKAVGMKALNALFADNPRRILAGEPLS